MGDALPPRPRDIAPPRPEAPEKPDCASNRLWTLLASENTLSQRSTTPCGRAAEMAKTQHRSQEPIHVGGTVKSNTAPHLAKHRLVALLAVWAIVLLFAGGARANHTVNIFPTPNYPQPNCVEGNLCRADNYAHSYWPGDLGPKMKTAVNASMNQSYETTDLDVIYTDTPKFSGPGETDVIFDYIDLPGNTIGRTECEDVYDSLRCDQVYVFFDVPDSIADDPTMLHALACHEIGHSVGLLHGDNAYLQVPDSDPMLNCMRTPVPRDVALGGHNVGQINGVY